MTQDSLIEQIIQTIEYNNDKDAREGIKALLNVLEPRDRIKFSAWGQLDDKSKASECWPLIN